MTGYELAQRLRALPELDGITLIAQTGGGRKKIGAGRRSGSRLSLIQNNGPRPFGTLVGFSLCEEGMHPRLNDLHDPVPTGE